MCLNVIFPRLQTFLLQFAAKFDQKIPILSLMVLHDRGFLSLTNQFLGAQMWLCSVIYPCRSDEAPFHPRSSKPLSHHYSVKVLITFPALMNCFCYTLSLCSHMQYVPEKWTQFDESQGLNKGWVSLGGTRTLNRFGVPKTAGVMSICVMRSKFFHGLLCKEVD